MPHCTLPDHNPPMDPVGQKLSKAWRFDPTEELPGGYCSRVYANDNLVLKVPFQGEEQTTGHTAALRLASTVGPRVHRSDQETGSLLMQRLRPGFTLDRAALEEEGQMEVVAGLIERMRDLPADGLVPLAEFVDARDPLVPELLASAPEPIFLHGDLHHFNILRHGGDWRVIDAKGLVGDPAFEITAFLRNPIERLAQTEDLVTLTRRRIVYLSTRLGLSPWRVAAWSLVDRRSSRPSNPEHPWGRLVGALECVESEFR